MSKLQIQREPEKFAGDICFLKVGTNRAAIVDPDDYENLKKYRWRLRMSGSCFYAVRREHTKNGVVEIKLHREIMHTPDGFDCHHKNHDTLDCRKCNLENLTKNAHQLIHKPSSG
jgi:hypothetical protein